MAQQAFLIGHFHTAQDQFAAFHQTVNIITMTNTHCSSFFLFRAGQILPRRDLQIGVISLCQLHGTASQLKQAAIVRNKAGFFLVQFFQRGQIGGTVKALGRLHRIQGTAVRGRLHHTFRRDLFAIAPGGLLDGVFHGHRRGSGPAFCSGFHHGLNDRLAHKGTSRIVDGHQLSMGGQHTVFGALGPGGTALHHLHGLCAGSGLRLNVFAVLARHQNDLAHQRALLKRADAPAQHGLPAQIKTELVKSHPGGGACRHQNSRYTLFQIFYTCPVFALPVHRGTGG